MGRAYDEYLGGNPNPYFTNIVTGHPSFNNSYGSAYGNPYGSGYGNPYGSGYGHHHRGW